MRSRRQVVGWLVPAALLCLSFPASPVRAQVGADINITPKRIVFAPGKSSGTVVVINRGQESATYNVTLVDRVMTADGRILAIDDDAAKKAAGDAIGQVKSAQPLIVYTPRRVTLGAGESQIIRIRALRPADLASGEYRTHLTVTAIPPETTGLTAEQAAGAASGQVGVQLTALFSVSIPLIVRQGAVDAQAAIEHIAYATRPKAGGGQEGYLRFDLVRKAASSIYGDIEVRLPNAGKSSAPLGEIRGLAVYPEISRRTVEVPLTRTPASGQRLEVVFQDDDTKPGQTLATEFFNAP